MDNKYLDDPILNEVLEDYFDSLDTVNEGIISGIKNGIKNLNANLKEKELKRLMKFLEKCAGKIFDNKNKYKYFCILETKTTRTYQYSDGYSTTYSSYPVVCYELYGSNSCPFKKELLNKKIIKMKMWQKEIDAKRLTFFGFDSKYLIKLNKNQLPDKLHAVNNLAVIYHDTNIFSDDY